MIKNWNRFFFELKSYKQQRSLLLAEPYAMSFLSQQQQQQRIPRYPHESSEPLDKVLIIRSAIIVINNTCDFFDKQIFLTKSSMTEELLGFTRAYLLLLEQSLYSPHICVVKENEIKLYFLNFLFIFRTQKQCR